MLFAPRDLTILWLTAGALLVLGSTSALAATEIIASFENDAEMAHWEIAGDWELSPEHTTDGSQSLRVRWPEGRGLITRGFPADWSAWDVLKVDCYNPGPPLSLTLRTDDEDDATISSWYHYARTGRSTLEFVIGCLSEKIDVRRIRMAHIRVDPPRSRPLEVFFDNLRFTREEPPEVYQPPATPDAAAPEDADSILPEGDFENGLQGWGSWGEWDGGLYEFGSGTGENAHSGTASAAIICARIGRGGIMNAPVTLPEAGAYALSFWVRGTLGGRIKYGLEGPGLEDVRDGTATEEWQNVTAEFEGEEGDQRRVTLYSCAPGTVYFDEVRLTKVEAERGQPGRRAPPTDPRNRISNPNFELGLQGWGSWGEWDDGEYEFGTGEGDDAYSGDYSAAVICNRKGRGGVFTQPMDLAAEEYALRFMVKASEPSSIRYGAIYPGGQEFENADIGTDWEEHTLLVRSEKDGEWLMYLMSTGEGTVYFDEADLRGVHDAAAPVIAEATPEGEPSHFEMRGGHTYLNGEPFFALGVYRAGPGDLQGTAFNCIPGWDQVDGATLDACQEAGVYLLPDLTGVMRGHLPHRVTSVARSMMRHPAVLGWYVCDEPDHQRWNVPPDEMRLATKLLHDMDRFHVTCSVVMQWAESNLYRYADTVDILMTDIYPIGDTRPADLQRIWYGTAVMRRAVADAKPIWTVIQATSRGTPEEHVAATYLAVVEGADGIFYWEYEDGHARPEVWDAVCGVVRELDSLKLALTGDDAGQQASCSLDAVRTLRKSTAEGDWLIAVNGVGEAAAGCAITIQGAQDGPAEALFEDRRVGVVDGVLTDDFEPFERHVYKLP